ncbi:peptidoglycan DD-metalloendopeptidase family protein [Yoonia sp.]|uniref:murein hydrolase activator EnvC family protein n=1 Tax=Yoonia sp. TaxID=2212373 RepID=UPI0025DEA64E|nr:peptidoglycan DD-metalloendopeptidase family protein [Yoonia sp.]
MRIAALLICLALPVAAQSPGDAAQAAAQRLEAAQMRMAEARGAPDRVKALTETVQAYEDGLTAMRDSLRQVAMRETAIETDLDQNREEVAKLLGVLQTISQTPAPVLLTHPRGPLGAARSGMMVADVTPALQAKVMVLQDQLTEITQLRTLQQDAVRMLTDGLGGAQTARAALGLAISQRTDLPLRFQEDPIQTALLLASTDTLAAFASRMADSAPDLDTRIAPTGNLPLPVRGQVLPDGDRAGILIAAAPRALVTAPIAATILFRGPLLEYGNVMILEPSADVLFVIAGLAEVFGEPGEIVAAGAPLGLLGGEQLGVDGILTENSQIGADDGQQTLYLEVREGQSPVNPDAWFALEQE